MNPYSALKAGWHREQIEQMRRGERVVPRQVQLILSDLCNHDCSFCAYRISEGFSSEQFGEDTGNGFTMNPNRMIPYEKAEEIIHDLATCGVPAVQFTGGGEPTVHPRHMDLFALAQSEGLETALVTNGGLLRRGWESVLPRMAWIRFSLDAGTAETYARVRRVSHAAFGKTLQNLALLATEIRTQEQDCVLGCSYIVTNDNAHEISQAARLAKDAGARYLRVAACFTTEGVRYYRRPLADYHQQIRRAKDQYEDETFDVVDMFASRAEDLEAQSPRFQRCGYSRMNVYIAGNLRCYLCCTNSYTPHGETGDLRNRTFKDWLFDPETTRRYTAFDARSCRTCPFREKNEVINYMIDEPTHKNFV